MQDPTSLAGFPRNYIQHIPIEVLSMIFTHFIRNQPTHIRRLLLVCREWFSIVTKSPSFWTQICLTSEITVDAKKLLSRTTYVRTCIERSQNLLLNIVIEYEYCTGVEECCAALIRDEVRDLLPNIPKDASVDDTLVAFHSRNVVLEDSEGESCSDDEEAPYQRENNLEWWLARIDWDNCSVQSQLEKYYILPLQHLVGREGEVMKRWKSFSIAFPSTANPGLYIALTIKVMRLFVYPAPFLESLFLNRLYGKLPLQIGSRAFPNVPSLTTLRLFADTFQIISPSINHSQLVDLYVHIENFEQLQVLSWSGSLRRLGLSLPQLPHFDLPSSFTLQFPHLRELKCWGFIPLDLRGHIHAPHLEVLYLEDDDALRSMKGCLFASVVKQLIISTTSSFRYSMLMPNISTEVLRNMQAFVSLKEICVYPSDKEAIEKYLIQLRGSGYLPSLRTLVIGNSFDSFDEKIDLL